MSSADHEVFVSLKTKGGHNGLHLLHCDTLNALHLA